jgi:hypothetical protein
MVKKAETLKSIEELKMSKRAKTYFKNSAASLDEIIWKGRAMLYIYDYNPEAIKKGSKSLLELIGALDEAGYIRHDINSGSFCVGNLYRMVFNDMIDPIKMPSFLYDFLETVDDGETICYVDYHTANERYESFVNPTDEQLDAIIQSLRTRLDEREYEILAYRLGFEDGDSHDFNQTCRHFGINRDLVRQIEAKTLRKLRKSNTLPAIVPSSDEQKAEVVTLIKKSEEITRRLYEISKTPFDCANDAAKYLNGGALVFSDIDRLELSARTYNCLKRAGINTVADIIKFPKGNWPRVRNLGRNAMEEIEIRVRAAGYSDFSVENLS